MKLIAAALGAYWLYISSPLVGYAHGKDPVRPLENTVGLVTRLSLASQVQARLHNWYFDFRSGETVDRVSGIRNDDAKETVVFERSLGYYDGNTFVSKSVVSSEAGARIVSGTARWRAIGDHLESEMIVGDNTYHCIILVKTQRLTTIEIYVGSRLFSKGTYLLQQDVLTGTTEIFDENGRLATVCHSECRKVRSTR
jgi:hypothetical protein